MFVAVSSSDWLEVSHTLAPSRVDVFYVGLLFNTGLKRVATRQVKGRRVSSRDVWPTMEAYLAWFRERLAATVLLLKPTGNLLVHMDWRINNRVRVMLTELLGADRFVNHVNWSCGLGGCSPRIPATSRRMKEQMKKATDVLDIPAINNMAAERTGCPTQKPLQLLESLVMACAPQGDSAGPVLRQRDDAGGGDATGEGGDGV